LRETQWTFTVQTAMFDVLGLGAILLAMQEKTLGARMLCWRPLRALGRISYGFYLFHDIPHELYDRAATWMVARLPFALHWQAVTATVTAVLAFCCTILLAKASFRFIEQPFLRLKNRWA
jgi:peptidoglycan/LPS O-acetylase OafA/YrhL